MTVSTCESYFKCWRECAYEFPLGRRILFVGENNPQSVLEREALWPHDTHASGSRLMKILGLSWSQYVSCWRTNLCPGEETWDSKNAIHRGVKLIELESPPWSTVVFLGSKVQKLALPRDVRPENFERRIHTGAFRPINFVSLPHPSGLCREWNDPESEILARLLMKQCEPEIPWQF